MFNLRFLPLSHSLQRRSLVWETELFQSVDLLRNISGFIFIVSVLFAFVVVVDLVLFVMNGDKIRDYELLVSYQNLSNKR